MFERPPVRAARRAPSSLIGERSVGFASSNKQRSTGWRYGMENWLCRRRVYNLNDRISWRCSTSARAPPRSWQQQQQQTSFVALGQREHDDQQKVMRRELRNAHQIAPEMTTALASRRARNHLAAGRAHAQTRLDRARNNLHLLSHRPSFCAPLFLACAQRDPR